MSDHLNNLTYDDLNGEEVKSILHTRFYELLKGIPQLQHRFALSRAILRIEIVMDIWGSTPPRRIIHDKFEITANSAPPEFTESVEAHHELSADADARNNPPDLIREEHGLPLPRAVRSQAGILNTNPVLSDDEPKYPQPPTPTPQHLLPSPANAANPTTRQVGKRTYAGWVDQDYGSLQAGDRKGSEGPVIGADKIADAGSRGGDHAPAQVDFRIADYRGVDPSKARSVIDETVDRGRRVDQTLIDNRRKDKKK